MKKCKEEWPKFMFSGRLFFLSKKMNTDCGKLYKAMNEMMPGRALDECVWEGRWALSLGEKVRGL